MPHPESSPLLPRQNGDRNYDGLPATNRLSAFLKSEGQPGWFSSLRWFFFSSWLNVFLVFVPLCIVAEKSQWDVLYRFSFSFLAIIPLAKLLGDATEQIAIRVGQVWAGLLNASFGNAVEIIVGVAALFHDQIEIVQTSLLGSILSNILLVLGCSFLAAGYKRGISRFSALGAQATSSLMTLACITLVIPAAYYSSKPAKEKTARGPADDHGILIISRGTALILLFLYFAYLYFQLHWQAANEPDVSGPHSPVTPDTEVMEEEIPTMNTFSAVIALVGVTVVTSICADYLVASIEEFAERYHIGKPFIGLILLPIVANAAEHVSAVMMAYKNRMEATIAICVGSSIQIATFVVPLLVIVGWISHHELSLCFANFETIVLFVSVLLVNTLIQDGLSNYLEGLMLIGLYLVIALAFWVS